jgi:hypothetical protein
MISNDGKPYDITVFKNIFDEKGNIKTREKYWNNLLVEKTIYKITYRSK